MESRVLLALVLLPLAAANYRGVRGGVSTSTTFAAAKLVPLAVFVLVGTFTVVMGGGTAGPRPVVEAGAGDWLEAILLLVFAYGGFESALLPLGEARNPRRDAPVALFTALGLCALIYTLGQIVVIAMLADPAASDRPLAAAAEVFLGPFGAWLMAAGALVSVYGYLSAAMLNVPRLTYAMAAEGDLPPALGAVHPKFRTPHVSVGAVRGHGMELRGDGELPPESLALRGLPPAHLRRRVRRAADSPAEGAPRRSRRGAGLVPPPRRRGDRRPGIDLLRGAGPADESGGAGGAGGNAGGGVAALEVDAGPWPAEGEG